ncbi:MAG: pirin family protein [Bacteroides sp.]|nr:pirin family protein [Bacteroides sp.]
MTEKLALNHRIFRKSEQAEFHITLPQSMFHLKENEFRRITQIETIFLKKGEELPGFSFDNTEILYYVNHGILNHKDNTGVRGEVTPRTSLMLNTGSGMKYREEAETDVELVRISMTPHTADLSPSSMLYTFSPDYRPNEWKLIAGEKEGAPLHIRNAVNVYDLYLEKGKKQIIPFATAGSYNYLLYCLAGKLQADQLLLMKGDTVYLSGNTLHTIQAPDRCKVLLLESV